MRDTILVSQNELNAQQGYMRAVAAHPSAPHSYHIITYGCQMNAHDSEILAGMFQEMGMEKASSREEADLVLFNTCCIRDNAERKALGNIAWLKEIRKNQPGMIIGVCGCMVEQKGMLEMILKRYPFVDFAFGTGNIHKMPQLILSRLDKSTCAAETSPDISTMAEGLPMLRDSLFKAYVTIMYGCDNFCSYCIVPYVRGSERSRTMDDVLREVEALQRQGVREITLLGQNVNSYGSGANVGGGFVRLLRKISEFDIPRIRFMTSHPKDLSDELIEEIARNGKICPHLHLPVQSGSNAVLAAMNRRYTREQYLDKVTKLRSAVPGIGLSTDLIVAFPGETEQDFMDTLSLVTETRFDSAFTFVFSPRKGTLAAGMPAQIDPAVAKDRIERLIAVQDQITKDILKCMIGQSVSVLAEGYSKRSPSQLTGKCERNISVNFDGSAEDIGTILPLRVTGAGSSTLHGAKN
jgi:tRNA-2-methylthio-N6-dimethylallyladenosine synthase